MAKVIWDGSAGDNDWSTAANWSTGSVPVASDDVYIGGNAFAGRNSNITAGLNQSAVALASLTIYSDYTGQIGDASTYLQVGATRADIGVQGSGVAVATGSDRLKIDFGSITAATIYVDSSSGTSADADLPPIQLLAANASTDLHVRGNAQVGLAVEDQAETSTIDDVFVSESANVTIGEGVTMGDITIINGNATLKSSVTNATVVSGALTTLGDLTITTLTVRSGGVSSCYSTGTITTLNWLGNVSFSGQAARTVTNANVYLGASGIARYGVVTFTNGVDFIQVGQKDTSIDFGEDYTSTLSSI